MLGESSQEHLLAEAQKMEQQRLAREMQAYVIEQWQREVSPERKLELNQQLLRVTDFFNSAGITNFIAGGSGIDLLDTELNRDHQDVDVAILGSDRETFYQAAVAQRYLVTDPDRKALSLEEIKKQETHNAFLFRSDEHGVSEFEVMFLNETSSGNVELTKEVSISRASFDENAPKINIGGKEIRLQPPEVILFYKLLDGRRKDFADAQQVWGTLSQEQQNRLFEYVHASGARFLIDGREITDVATLFDMAKNKDEELRRMFFNDKVPEFRKDIEKDLMRSCEDVFEIRKSANDRSVFFQIVGEKYQGFIPERRVVMEAMADFLFQTPSPNLEQFTLWAKKQLKLDERLKQKAYFEFVSEKLWQTRHG